MREESGEERKEEAEQTLKELFEQIDIDGSGTLDRTEVARMARLLDKPMDDDDLDAAMASMDDDHSGEVDFTEFAAWWHALKIADKADGGAADGAQGFNTMLRYGTSAGAGLLIDP